MRGIYFSQENVKNFSSLRFFVDKIENSVFFKKEEGTEALKEN
ncbi:Protein of unknown function [Bacillus cereus]|nr:hypothetical protein [Bacillus wiedmannii]MEE3945189.1 hypothetical protein [Bacillus wiedmannii]SCC65732.1 Protein of unknown function [Bacillus cereus]